MTLGYHAPPPESASGVAVYASRLASELSRHLRLIPNADRADLHLYHLGNNQLHWPIYRRALAHPGVVLLHDANLHHMFLGALGEGEYVAEFAAQYGAWHQGLAHQLWRGRARSAADPVYFEYTLLRRIVERSTLVVVHNEAAAAKARHAGAARVAVIPHFIPEPPAPDESALAVLRQRFGFAPGCFVAGVFGHLRESKRLAPLLRAFRIAHAESPSLRLLIAGAFVSQEYEAAIAPLLAQPGVVRAGYVKEESAFWQHLYLADACVNLRYPSCGESSGIAAHMAAAAKPLIVTAGDEWSGFPPGTLLPVDASPAETGMLAGYLIWLSQNRGHGRQLGSQTAAWARRSQSLSAAGSRLAGLLKGDRS